MKFYANVGIVGVVLLTSYGKLANNGNTLIRMPRAAKVNGVAIDCEADTTASSNWRKSNGWCKIIDTKPTVTAGQVAKVCGYSTQVSGGVTNIVVNYECLTASGNASSPLEIAESISAVSTANMTQSEKTALLKAIAEYIILKK